MKVEMKINEKLDSEIKEAIEYALEQERGYNDGYPDRYIDNDGDLVYDYTTNSGMGSYRLYPNRTLIFRGRRNSFKDGNDLFFISQKNVEEWEIFESQEKNRTPWD